MRKSIPYLVITAIIGGAAFFNANYAPSRVAEAKVKAQEEAQKTLEEIHEKMEEQGAAPPEIQLAENTASEQKMSTLEEIPEVFKVKFECSNGDFVMELHKDWSPLGVQRLYDMVQNGVFNEARFFRVVPNFVVQWGIPADPAVAAKWREDGLKDEEVKQSNTQGMVTFAKSGAPNSRTTQMFINLRNNQNLDAMGFSPIGKIVEGFDVVQKINPEYGESPNQGMIQSQGNEYLTKAFPNLDYIKSASIMAEEAADKKESSAKEEGSAKQEAPAKKEGSAKQEGSARK